MPTEKQLQNREAWLNALRSGEFKQGQGNLLKNGKYCCLGVAAEVSGCSKEEAPEGSYHYGASLFTFPDKECGDETTSYAYVPVAWFADLYGLSLTNARVLSTWAVSWNDTTEYGFPAVASMLEKSFGLADRGEQLKS